MNDLKQSIYIIAALLIGAIQFSCSKNQVYQSKVEIPDGIWASENAAIFEPNIEDSLQLFDINLSISNSNEYRYSNIWFFIRSISPAGNVHMDTVEVLLAEEDGKWIGKKASDLYSFEYNFQKQVRFPKTGKYTFEIFQGMRDLELKGIHSVGFEIEKNN